MLVFRCTQKLLAQLGAKPIEPPCRSTTQLGDWYAGTLAARNKRLLIFVSETTFLSVVIKASESTTIIPRFRGALDELLIALETDEAARAQELDDGGGVVVAKTASRQVLGVMNDFAFQAKCLLQESPAEELFHLSLRLNQTPCGPLGYVRPSDATRKQLARSGPAERAW